MSNQPETEYDKIQQRRGRLIAAALILVIALPMLVAYVVYQTGIGMPTGTVNNGDLLVPPQSFAQLGLQTPEGEPWDITEERKRWRLLIPGYRSCDSQCERNLYLTRQVHIRLAKDAYRIERFYVLLDESLDDATATLLEEEHPGLRVMRTGPAELQALLANTNITPEDQVAAGHYYLMDQQGYLMMAYTPAQNGNQLLADIKRMLKVTYDD
jgi:cytochrome oxidase Cu insertion factor (SCO1/SenC/PrrC family)